MLKVDGKPKFDAITLGELHVNRIDQPGDRVTTKYAFLNSRSHQTMGWSSMEGMVMMSDRSKELLSELVDSLERDAAKVLFENDQSKEVSDEYEPEGLADAGEEADQI